MGAPEPGVGPETSGPRADGDGMKPAVTAIQLLVMLGVGAFAVLFFIKTQDAMILIFGLLAATMVGLGWSRIAGLGARREPAGGSAASTSMVGGSGAMIRLAVQLGVGAFAVLFFIRTQDAMILIFGVIAIALVELVFRRR